MIVHRTLLIATVVLLACVVVSLPASKLAAQEAQSGGEEWVQPLAWPVGIDRVTPDESGLFLFLELVA